MLSFSGHICIRARTAWDKVFGSGSEVQEMLWGSGTESREVVRYSIKYELVSGLGATFGAV
jgi:hypothetical protein